MIWVKNQHARAEDNMLVCSQKGAYGTHPPAFLGAGQRGNAEPEHDCTNAEPEHTGTFAQIVLTEHAPLD